MLAQKGALAIYQDFLDVAGDALVAGDSDTFLDGIYLPHVLITESNVLHLSTREAVQLHFDGFYQALMAQKVDAYTRIADKAWIGSDGTLHGEHRTFITSRGKLVVPEFANEISLVQRDGVWGAVRTRHFAKYVAWPHLLPKGPTG